MIRLLGTSGRGPAECRIAVVKGIAILTAEATELGLDGDCIEGANTDGHGPASATCVRPRARGSSKAPSLSLGASASSTTQSREITFT